MSDDNYDVIVLGGGSTGENVAARAAQGGMSAAVVESDLLGGDCSYWACMPSKALLRPPEAADAARSVGGAAEAITGPLDAAAVFARRNGFVSNWDDAGQARWLEGASAHLIRGHGRLAGERSVEVDTGGGRRTLTANHAVAICTGSEPSPPPIAGLAEAHPWTSKDATSAGRTPGRLAILGGGVVACEMAHAYRALGSEVVILERGPRLLGGNEPFAGELLGEAFTDRGVDVRTGVTTTRVDRHSDRTVTLTLEDGGTVTADELLVAAGRGPRTRDIGLGAVGLNEGHWVSVDDTCRVTGVAGGWLYAAGDVNGRALLTHMGKYQARACGDTIVARAQGKAADAGPWSRYTATADHAAVPQVVFTDPQIGSVGRTERRARESGLAVGAVEFDLGGIAGAVLHVDGYRGRAKLVIDEDRRVVVGAAFVGPAVGELVHAATIAIVGEVPIDRLWHAVPSFPTISEVWLRLFETYGL